MDGLSKYSWETIKHNFYRTGELPDNLEKILQLCKHGKKLDKQV